VKVGVGNVNRQFVLGVLLIVPVANLVAISEAAARELSSIEVVTNAEPINSHYAHPRSVTQFTEPDNISWALSQKVLKAQQRQEIPTFQTLFPSDYPGVAADAFCQVGMSNCVDDNLVANVTDSETAVYSQENDQVLSPASSIPGDVPYIELPHRASELEVKADTGSEISGIRPSIDWSVSAEDLAPGHRDFDLDTNNHAVGEFAQSQEEAEGILEETESPDEPVSPQGDLEVPAPQFCDLPVANESSTISVEDVKYNDELLDINVVDSSVPELRAEIEEALASVGRTVTPITYEDFVSAVSQIYLNEGYLTSTAMVDEPSTTNPGTFRNGQLTIRVREAGVSEIVVNGLDEVSLNYFCSRVEMAATPPLNIENLEDQLRLLREDPLFKNVEAVLQSAEDSSPRQENDSQGNSNSGSDGRNQFLSKLTLTVTEENPASLLLFSDNYSPPSIGSERFGAQLGYANLSGIGDSASATYFVSSTGGADAFNVSYKVPLNPMNGTLEFRAGPQLSEVTQAEFASFGFRGESELYQVIYRQPRIRTTKTELAFSLGFYHRRGQTFVGGNRPQRVGVGPDINGVTRTSVFTLGQDYVSRDLSGAWAFQSQLKFGTGLLDATINDAPVPDSNFFSWLGVAERFQYLNDSNLLIIQGIVQLTPNSLLSSEQFVLGGGQSVRGYRQNARSGDNGFRFSVEDRITVNRFPTGEPRVQLIPFVDMGAVWNSENNPNPLKEQNFLIGAGLGLLWDDFLNLDGLRLRADYGVPLIDSSDRSNNLQDSGGYFRIEYETRL
ncbi:MAG: ShlB/FhaC/HecB family hemolysin secretion/activation protein, partial [Cyanobacteria bacterium J06555_13]